MRVHMLGTAEADRIPPGLEVPVDESFSGLVFTTQEPVVVRSPEDARRASRRRKPLLREIGVESFCVLPLTTIVRRLGAIGFGSLSPYAFGEAELEFLRQVARQVAVAVDNVLHDESDRAAQRELSQERDRLRLLLDVSESIASYRDLERSVRRCSAERLPQLVPFDFINLRAPRSGAQRDAPADSGDGRAEHDPAGPRDAGGRSRRRDWCGRRSSR